MQFIKLLYPIIGLAILAISSCQSKKETPVIAQATEADFEEEKTVSPILAEDFEMSLWAPGPLLHNAVALTFGNDGVAYVAETNRRKSSDLDIREHRNWMTQDFALESIEDTRAFHLKELATDRSDENTWLEDFNGDGIHDYKDLSVQSEIIRRVWDSDGDGRADRSQIYAEGFNDMLTGVAAGILNYDDQVYLTAAPHVWKLEDTDKDGVADERALISEGYGIHIAYAGHDMSGLTMGSDGKIYWSIGDMGVNSVGPDGVRWAYPHEGAVMRSNPDGSEFEVFAHGLRNPQEIDFDAYGNLISVDNDGDHQGEHERYVHIIEGSDSGWRIYWQFGKYNEPNEEYKIWMDEKLYIPHFPGQAAYLLPPIALAYNGPAGLAFNPGDALSPKWKNHFFASYFTASSAQSKIQAFELKAKGASFEIINEQDIVGGIVPTGITFAPDGALYINDWKDSYDKKPTGRIWKLDVAKNAENSKRKETEALIKSGVKERTTEDLKALLAHSDRRIRLMAQFELVKRQEAPILIEVALEGTDLLARLHAIWGIGQLERQGGNALNKLFPLFNDANENIRGQLAKVVGESKIETAFAQLIKQVKDGNESAQFFAVEALGKIGNPDAFQPLVDLLEETGDSDPHLRHAIVYAMSRIDQVDAIANLSSHASDYVRLGAVVALRHLRSKKVAAFLTDQNPLVVIETARAIHDDLSVPNALEELAGSLNSNNLQDEAYVRRAINANLRLGNQQSANRLKEYALNPNAPIEMRADALWALGYWGAPPELDRVEGCYRILSGHVLSDAQATVNTMYPTLIKSKSAILRAAIISAIGRTKVKSLAPEVFAAFRNKTNQLEIRKSALDALALLESPDLNKAIDLAIADQDPSLRQSGQKYLSTTNLPEDELIQLYSKILDNNPVPEKQLAFSSLGKLRSPEVEQLLSTWFEKIKDNSIAPELALDVMMAIENSEFENLKNAKSTYESSIDADDLQAAYKMALKGGNYRKGFRLFTRNSTAQCLRCHAYKGYGGAVGPELTHIASTLSHEQLLASLVDPNARIAPGYGSVYITMNDKTELAGVLENEDETSITIKVGTNPSQTIPRSDIAELETLPSGMFNMGNVLSKSQIRDLMAVLVTLE